MLLLILPSHNFYLMASWQAFLMCRANSKVISLLLFLQFPSIKHSVQASAGVVTPGRWLNAEHLLKANGVPDFWRLFWTVMSLCLMCLRSQVTLKPSPGLADCPGVKIKRGKSWACFDFLGVFFYQDEAWPTVALAGMVPFGACPQLWGGEG